MKKISVLVCLVALVGCEAKEALNATKGMPGEMRVMQNEMVKTNEAVRLQKLALSLDRMFSDQNTDIMTPPPSGMLSGAKKFAEFATSQELIEQVYAWLLEINEQVPDESLRVNGSFPKEVVQRVDFQKMQRLVAIQAVAGFTPDFKVREIVDVQIQSGGVYQEAAYTFLAARGFFIADYLVSRKILSRKVNNLEKLNSGLSELRNLKYIFDLGLGERVALKVTGFLDPSKNIDLVLDPGIVGSLRESLLSSASVDMEEKYRTGELTKTVRALESL
ncbi:MAG: hypothetical protein IT289_00920 [Oligoflexia bacterium]|nr:hypothetical protein [Oligoflexia bacterium]